MIENEGKASAFRVTISCPSSEQDKIKVTKVFDSGTFFPRLVSKEDTGTPSQLEIRQNLHETKTTPLS